MALEYDDQAGPNSLSSIMSGATKRWWFWRWEDVETEGRPEVLAPGATNAAALVNIEDAHVFKTGKRMYEVYATENTVKFKSSRVGGKDSYGFKTEMEAFLPGISAEALGMGVMAQNDKIGAIVELMNGTKLQVSSKAIPGTLTFDFEIGEAEQGGLGMLFKIAAYDKTVAIYVPEPQITPEA